MAVRREKVILDLEDHLSTGMARAAAATALLDRELGSLSRQSVETSRTSANISRDVDGIGRSARDTDASINQLTGRLRVMAEVAAILGPSLVPIGAVAIPAVTGLAAQLGFAAVAGGVLMGSMRGLGGAIEAMNKADLEPTVENLAKAEDALNALAPAARKFAVEVRDLAPHLKAIRDAGAESLVPGLIGSLDDLERLGPKVAAIFDSVGGALGDIAATGAESLASERWADFFEFIATDAPEALTELTATIGNVTHGMAEMWMAFDPLNDDFSSWLLRISEDFDRWATGLDQTEGFQEFVAYIRENGPQVADTMGALGNAMLQIVQASAPLGGPVLKSLEAVADVVSAIADSDLGTPIMAGVAALSLLNRTLAVTASLSKVSLSTGIFAGVGTLQKGVKSGSGSIKADLAAMSSSMVAFGHDTEKAGKAAERMKGRLAGLGQGAALMGGLAIASTGAADSIGLTNTASLALVGTLGGPFGIAAGAAVGAFLDMRASAEATRDAFDSLAASAATGDQSTMEEQLLKAQALREGMRQLGVDTAYADDAISKHEKAIADLGDEQVRAEAAARQTAVAYARSVGVNMEARKSSLMTAKAIEEQAKAMVEAREKASALADTFGGLGESLNKSEKSFGEWVAEMQASTRALADFNDNSLKAARRGLDQGLTESLRAAGKEGALRMEQLANGTQEGIKRANAAYRALQAETERTRRVTEQLARSAVNDIQAVAREISALDGKSATVTIRTVRMESGKGPSLPADVEQRADGGYITGPGTATSDSIPAYLSNGEYVVRAAAVEKYGTHFFDGLNAMRFADGGSVDKKRRKTAFELDPDFGAEARERRREERERRAEDRANEREQRERRIAEAIQEGLEGQLLASREWMEAAETQKTLAEQARDDIAATMKAIGSAATAPFQSGLFTTGSAWSAGGGWLSALTNDIAGLNERNGIIAALSAAGLDGDALGTALEQGSNAQLQALLNSGQVQQFEDMFNQRAALTLSVGAAAGQAAFGPEFAAAQAQVDVMAAAVAALSAEVTRITELANPTSAASQAGYQMQAEVIANGVGNAIVNGGNTVARRGGR